MATLVALAIYDQSLPTIILATIAGTWLACAIGLYARTSVVFRPYDRDRRMPLLLSFVLIGFFLWLAESRSLSSASGGIRTTMGAWAVVHLGKRSSWSRWR